MIDILYALADLTRLEIVVLLANAGKKLTCGDIDLNRPKSSMSHHFKILRSAELVETVVDGTEHMNALRLEEIEQKYPGVLKSVLESTKVNK